MGMMIRRNRLAKEAEVKPAPRPEEFGLPFVDVPEATAKGDKLKTVKRKAGKPKFD